MSEEELKNKMDTFIECYKNGMIFGAPTDIEFYEKIATLQQKVEQLENIRKEAIKYILKNKLYRFKYDDEELFEITTDKKTKDDLLKILNKGSDKDV